MVKTGRENHPYSWCPALNEIPVITSYCKSPRALISNLGEDWGQD